MKTFAELYQAADWKAEKHVPVIEIPDTIGAGDWVQVRISLGKAIEHPNTTEHHIRWITVYFHPEGAKFPYEVGRFEFNAHGESGDGPNTGPVYTNHEVTTAFKVTKPGTIFATSFCNIHGLWRGEKELKLS